MTERVTVDDLEFAVLWLREYDNADNGAPRCERVARWIQAEIDRRYVAHAKREIAAGREL